MHCSGFVLRLSAAFAPAMLGIGAASRLAALVCTLSHEALADAVNSWLLNMSIRASGDHGIRDWMDVGVLGYRTHNLTPLITPALVGALAGRSLVSIVDVANKPARIETTT